MRPTFKLPISLTSKIVQIVAIGGPTVEVVDPLDHLLDLRGRIRARTASELLQAWPHEVHLQETMHERCMNGVSIAVAQVAVRGYGTEAPLPVAAVSVELMGKVVAIHRVAEATGELQSVQGAQVEVMSR